MKLPNRQESDNDRSSPRWLWFIGAGCVLMVLLLILRPRPHVDTTPPAGVKVVKAHITKPANRTTNALGSTRSKSALTPSPAAEEIVSEKVRRFARGHEEIVSAIAKKLNINVPVDINRFFAAMQAGHWEESTNLFASLQKLRKTTGWERGVETLWPAVTETYGVAEQAHNWPAQKLLDYGNEILESLRPGMIYVGGTDAGRFIPTLLTETSEGESHIVLTQNSLADATYLDYLRFRYGDRMNTLGADDGQNGFTTYLQDAQKRLQHDEQFPNEPKQLRSGEDIKVTENRVQVSGPVAVMMINEQLLQKLLQKNPDLSFALEESTSMKSFYAGATTLGPVTELRADAANALSAEQAAQSIEYWRSTTQNLITDPDATASSATRDAYAKLILGQANLFRDRNFSDAAEQAYQMANSLSPSQPEGILGYTNLLMEQKRYGEARQVVQAGLNVAPENSQLRELLARVSQLK